MSRSIVLLGLIVIGVGATLCIGDERPNQVRDFMRQKLTHTEKVLEGLALEDFDMMAKHSQELSLLSRASTWQVLQTQDYLDHSTEFRRSADRLTQAARNKNLDGAALAYVDVTMSCVNCHKYVRGTSNGGSRK